VQDTIEALVRLQRCPEARGQIFNVGGAEEITIRDLAAKVIEVVGSNSEIELVPYQEAYAPGIDDMRRRKPVVEKLALITGFRPSIELRQMIELTAGGAQSSSSAR
jgi:UDP-glucose 4-epimerase